MYKFWLSYRIKAALPVCKKTRENSYIESEPNFHQYLLSEHSIICEKVKISYLSAFYIFNATVYIEICIYEIVPIYFLNFSALVWIFGKSDDQSINTFIYCVDNFPVKLIKFDQLVICTWVIFYDVL